MTTQILRGQSFLGYPLTKLRAVLNAWETGTRRPDMIADFSTVQLAPGVVTAMLGEAFQRGLINLQLPEMIDPSSPDAAHLEHYGLSPAGVAVAAASASKRATKAKAKKVLDELLANAQDLLSDPRAVMDAGKIWVFGSFIDPEKLDVGDLDIVIEREQRPMHRGTGINEINTHIEENYPGTVADSVDWYRREEHWFKRMLFGTRRHRLIAETSLHTLIGLHTPCVLVFDKEQGGVIRPQRYPHHPNSKGRSKSIKERLVMPDLETVEPDFLPTDAVVFSNKAGYHTAYLNVIARGGGCAHRAARLDDAAIDGRNNFAVEMYDETGQHFLVQVSRHFDFSSDAQWSMRLSVDCTDYKETPPISSWAGSELSKVIEGVLYADILRLADRRDKLGTYSDILVDVEISSECRRIPGFVDALDRHGSYLIDGDPAPVPDQYRFGVDIDFPDPVGGYGYASPSEYDDDDWTQDWVAMDREAYFTWLQTSWPERHNEIVSKSQLDTSESRGPSL